MKVNKLLPLSVQKDIFENLFVWNEEDGKKPERPEHKKWILRFFTDKAFTQNYIDDLKSDVELMESDFPELTESYIKQINFLELWKQQQILLGTF